MSCSQDICYLIVLSLKDTFRLSQAILLSVLSFCNKRASTLLSFLTPVCHSFYKSKSVLPPTHVPRALIFGRPSLEIFADPLYGVVSLFLDLQMVVSDFTSDLDLLAM